MIYEFGRTIIHYCKSIRHFFRAMFCKHYWIDSHGLAECRVGGNGCWCKYWRCPKMKGVIDERSNDNLQ